MKMVIKKIICLLPSSYNFANQKSELKKNIIIIFTHIIAESKKRPQFIATIL